MWQDNKEKILKEADIPDLAKPITELLQDLETELETKYGEVNRRILSGENAHIKLTKWPHSSIDYRPPAPRVIEA